MNWGIIGYGNIAPAFVKALLTVEGNSLYGIASRSNYLLAKRAYPNCEHFSDYSCLLANSDVEIVYVCTTNNLHKSLVLDALRAGKHVICEKPMGICQPDVEEMVSEAAKQGRFLIEGMWTRFLPAYRHFVALLKDGVIGKVNFVQVDFGFKSVSKNQDRLQNHALMGGTVLDNADYNLFICQDIFREKPARISAFGRFIDTGVDDMCGVMLQYHNGAIAQLFSSFSQLTKQKALVYGDKGYLQLDEYWHGTTVELFADGFHSKWEFPLKMNGFEYQIAAVQNCIGRGMLESDLVPHSVSLQVAEVMDEIIGQIKNRSEKSTFDRTSWGIYSPGPVYAED